MNIIALPCIIVIYKSYIMKILSTLLCFLFIQSMAFSQFSISAAYSSNSSDIIDKHVPFEATSPSSIELGVAYWFRLKSKRVEFLPEVGYALYQMPNTKPVPFESASAFHFNFNTQIYPIDFHSDCSACPTFSKDGGLIKKGFYWIVSPGISSYKFDGFNDVTVDGVAFRIGLGAGLDIGLSNLLTISPFAKYNIAASVSDNIGESGTYNQLQFGLRAILRVDKDKW